MQVKYIDDSTQAASVNLKRSLQAYPVSRPRPLKYHERHQTILKPQEDIMQSELDRFYSWTTKNKLQINSKKCMTMQFSRSKIYDFPMDYSIGGSNMLEERDTLQILGVQVQSDLWKVRPINNHQIPP
jgi:hypothetical protein